MDAAEAVINYYDLCHKDYRLAWGLDRTQAIHYGFYDETARGQDEARANANRVLSGELGARAGQFLIDAGCGVGGTCLWLAEHVGARMLGVNIQPMHLQLARDLAVERRLSDRVSFALADYCQIPVDDGSADGVYSIEGVGHGPDKAAFIREAMRVLRPGGRLVLFDYFVEAAPSTARDKRDLERFMLGWALPNLPPVRDFESWIHSFGGQDVRYRDVTSHILPDARRMQFLCGLALPRTYWRVMRGRRPREVLNNRVSGWVQHRLFREGVMRYGILSAVRR